eukprot:2619140-Pyramimonas_sp.AAC.1
MQGYTWGIDSKIASTQAFDTNPRLARFPRAPGSPPEAGTWAQHSSNCPVSRSDWWSCLTMVG